MLLSSLMPETGCILSIIKLNNFSLHITSLRISHFLEKVDYYEMRQNEDGLAK